MTEYVYPYESELTPGVWVLTREWSIAGVHSPDKCAGFHCVLHNPSDHHMRDWPLNWRQDRHMMERICPHGVGHPDPDDINPDTIHGCDGCCAGPDTFVHPWSD